VREARPLTLQIDRDRGSCALSAISTRETTVLMVSRLFEKPRAHSVGTVIGTLRMASEAKVLAWKLPVQGGQAASESGARVGACHWQWTPSLTRIGVPGARLLSYYSCSTVPRLTIMFRLESDPWESALGPSFNLNLKFCFSHLRLPQWLPVPSGNLPVLGSFMPDGCPSGSLSCGVSLAIPGRTGSRERSDTGGPWQSRWQLRVRVRSLTRGLRDSNVNTRLRVGPNDSDHAISESLRVPLPTSLADKYY
jgi:hypothetical protein